MLEGLLMPTPPATYVFAPRERMRDATLRVLGDISGDALRLKAGPAPRGPVEESIHEGRLLFKRVRALLTLIRPALAPTAHDRVRSRLRKAAEVLGPSRDLAATRSTLEKVTRKAVTDQERAASMDVLEKLKRDRATTGSAEKSLGRALNKSLSIFEGTVNELMRSAEHGKHWPTRSHALKAAFQAMTKAGRKARRQERDVDFHTWRKKTKKLLYQLELAFAPPKGKRERLLKRLDKLQNALGEYHDCAVAEEHLPSLHAAPQVRSLIKRRKARMRRKSCKIARAIARSKGR